MYLSLCLVVEGQSERLEEKVSSRMLEDCPGSINTHTPVDNNARYERNPFPYTCIITN